MTIFNAADFDINSLDSSGGAMPAPGKVHAIVIDTIEKENDIEVQCVIKAHEKPGQESKKFRIWFKKDGKSLGRAFNFLIACRVTTKNEIARQLAAGNNVDLPFEKSRHCDFMTVLEASTYNGKPKVGVEFTFVNPYSPEAKGYPKYDFTGGGTAAAEGEEVPF
jgi:hypothetical protein